MQADGCEGRIVDGVTRHMEQAGIAKAGLFLFGERAGLECVGTGFAEGGDLLRCRSALGGQIAVRADAVVALIQ